MYQRKWLHAISNSSLGLRMNNETGPYAGIQVGWCSYLIKVTDWSSTWQIHLSIMWINGRLLLTCNMRMRFSSTCACASALHAHALQLYMRMRFSSTCACASALHAKNDFTVHKFKQTCKWLKLVTLEVFNSNSILLGCICTCAYISITMSISICW